LEVVNSLVHPLLEKDFLHWKSKQNSVYVIREAAILVESGGYKNCDYVVVVTAPVDIRVSRVVQRDRSTREDVLQRMKSQLPEEEISKHAHFCIRNNGDESLIEQVLRIHSEIVSGA
jgi:dephospho-CoA kinase